MRRQLDAFGDYHQAELPPRFLPPVNPSANIFNGEGNLGDQNHVSAPGNAGMKRDPSGIAAHHFDQHDAMMAFGGGVQAVNGIGGDVQGGVKAKGNLGGGEVVVNRLGHADDMQALAPEIAGDAQRAVSPNDDQSIQAQAAAVLQAEPGIVAGHFLPVFHPAVGKWIAAVGGAENRSATRQDSAHRIQRQFTASIRPDEPIEAVGNPQDTPAVNVDGCFYDPANHGVQTGAISAAIGHTNCVHRSPVVPSFAEPLDSTLFA